jgi:hypothetical protein
VVLPTPEFGIGLPIQSAVLRAVHEQPGVAVNSIGSSTCVEDVSAVEGEAVNWQGAAACATSTVWSETVRCPCRRVPFGLGCTVYATVASPCPLVAPRVIHESCELADHAHSRAVLSVRLPLPPVAGISCGRFVIDTPHFVNDGALTLVVADPPHPATIATMRSGQRSRGERTRRLAHMFACTGQSAAAGAN